MAGPKLGLPSQFSFSLLLSYSRIRGQKEISVILNEVKNGMQSSGEMKLLNQMRVHLYVDVVKLLFK